MDAFAHAVCIATILDLRSRGAPSVHSNCGLLFSWLYFRCRYLLMLPLAPVLRRVPYRSEYHERS